MDRSGAIEVQAAVAGGQRLGRGIRVARAIGWTLVLLALAALGYEALLALRTGSWRMLAAGELWYALDRGSLNLVQALIQRYVHPVLWDPVIQSVLTWSAWSLFGAPGVALLVALSGRGSRHEDQEEAGLGAA